MTTAVQLPSCTHHKDRTTELVLMMAWLVANGDIAEEIGLAIAASATGKEAAGIASRFETIVAIFIDMNVCTEDPRRYAHEEGQHKGAGITWTVWSELQADVLVADAVVNAERITAPAEVTA